jgi:CheY-like chemotaxis protein
MGILTALPAGRLEPARTRSVQSARPSERSTAAVGSFARIDVVDTGAGIDPAFLPHLFARFRQADASTTRSHGGLGLGLSIVRSLVEMHGGTVYAESRGAGAGSTFVVMLPLSSKGSERATDPVWASRLRSSNVPLSSPELIESIRGTRVLVVDDEPDARDFLRRVIEDFDLEVFVAASAPEALFAIAEHRPDVLLCDIGMPGEDGYQLIRKVRALDPEHGGRIPAAALTAYTRARDREKALELGFQVHVSKPVEPAHLAEIIAALVKKASAE